MKVITLQKHVSTAAEHSGAMISTDSPILAAYFALGASTRSISHMLNIDPALPTKWRKGQRRMGDHFALVLMRLFPTYLQGWQQTIVAREGAKPAVVKAIIEHAVKLADAQVEINRSFNKSAYRKADRIWEKLHATAGERMAKVAPKQKMKGTA